jgi:exodeoxyribonuclease VII large subunit
LCHQVYIIRIYPLGEGASFSQLRRLKKKLAEEGLFNASRKKSIPRLPRKIGIVTSKNSAAIKDIANVVSSRFPKMNLVIAPVSVQGEGAPKDIIKGLNHLLKMDEVDAVILARGGGPTEDLAPFNDEELVRTISASNKPIITGIGHEKDMTLADLAADFRASTPSTAARAAVPNLEEMRDELSSLRMYLDRAYNAYTTKLSLKRKEEEVNTKERQLSTVTMQLDGKDKAIAKYKVTIGVLALIIALISIWLLLFR